MLCTTSSNIPLLINRRRVVRRKHEASTICTETNHRNTVTKMQSHNNRLLTTKILLTINVMHGDTGMHYNHTLLPLHYYHQSLNKPCLNTRQASSLKNQQGVRAYCTNTSRALNTGPGFIGCILRISTHCVVRTSSV